MIKITPYLTLVFLLFSLSASAQHHKCGVTTEMGKMIEEQMIQNRNEMRDYVQVRNAVVYLPVRFFMVAMSDGSERTSEIAALKGLCQMNENYKDQDIQFYLKEFRYINNTEMHQFPFDAWSQFASQMSGKYNAINIFIVDQIGDPEPGGGVTLAYWQPPAGPNGNDWLVSAETYADDFEVLTHEVGHFFSLNHTFYGWEGGGWSDGVPTPVNAPGGGNIKTERADGSNCATSADRICDTPADYLHNFDPGCNYKDNALDPTGAPIDPDPNNFMTYNNSSCVPDLYFTDGQKEEIENSLNSSSRNYLPKNYVPSNLNPVTGIPTIVTPPQNLQTIPTYNSVKLEWTAVPNADHYLIQVTSLSGGTGTVSYIVTDTQITLTDLSPQNNYSFRVVGYNEYSTCGSPSGPRIFKTGNDVILDTSDIPGLSNWTLTPNPLRSGETLQLNLESEKGVTLDVMVSTVTGQTVQLFEGQQFANGISTFPIDTYSLPSGIYLVSLITTDGVLTKRVSIL